MNEIAAALLLVACFGVLAMVELLTRQEGGCSASDTAGRALTNFGLGISLMVVSSLPLLSRLGASSLGVEYERGLAQNWALGWPLLFVLTLLLQSLAAYWVHRLMHKVPLLWRVHRAHHADAHLDISTGLRNHPLELLVTLPVGAAVILLVGAPASVVIAVDTILFAGALWQHADFALPPGLERGLGRLFVTPAFHRTHHVPDRLRHDGNYGDIVIVWDRLFGTLQAAASRGERVGLDNQRARPDHLLEQLLGPFDRPHDEPVPGPSVR